MNPLLTSSLLSALLQSSLLVAGAWLLICTQTKISAARRSAACRFTMAAALGLAMTIVGRTAVALIPSTGISQSSITLPQGPGTAADNTLLIPSGNSGIEQAPATVPTKTTQTPQAEPLMLSTKAIRWLAAGWLTGAALVLMTWIASLWTRRALLGHFTNPTGETWLQPACQVRGWPCVKEVRLIPREITPCVWGVRKTVLALPFSATSWPTAKLKLILAHECAHLLRRDPLWQIVCRFFLALLWFHPCAWNLARRHQAADEQAADDAVLRTESDSPSYANLLVECARQFSLPPALQTTASTMASSTNLTRRVEAVLNPTADRSPAGFNILLPWAATITLLTVLCGYAAPVISNAPHQDPPEQQPAPKLAKGDEQPIFPAIPPKLKPEFKVSADSIIFPPETPATERTYILKGSVKLKAHSFTLGSDQMTLEMQSGQTPLIPTGTINELESAIATGSVLVEGEIDGTVVSAKANSAVYTQNPSGQTLTLTGWPRLQTNDRLIEAKEQDSIIIIGPSGGFRVEKCRISDAPKTEQPSPATPSPTEAPAAPPSVPPTPETKDEDSTEAAAETEAPRSPFDWKIVSINGLDYLSALQLQSFYKFPTLTTDESGNFFLRSKTMIIKGAPGSNEIFVNNVRFFLKHPVLPSENGAMISRHDLAFMLDPIIRPTYIEGFEKVTTVVIDAGHGGTDSGANGSFGKESTYTLDMAQRLQRLLGERGIKAILTRNDDSFVPLKERSAIAAAQSEAILLSLHFNWDGGVSQQGIITYFPEAPSAQPGPVENQESSAYSRACIALATAVHANSLYKVRGTDGGVRAAQYNVISGQTKTPAILIEGGYLSHPGEAARIAKEEFRQTLAEAIAGGVENYIRARRKGSIVPKRQ